MSAGFLPAQWPAPDNVLAGTTLRNGSYRLPSGHVLLRQVHGSRVVRLGSDEFAAGEPEADAVIGARPGDTCVVKTADCLPVLLCAADGGEIAAIHAGWRGLAAGVIEATVGAMRTGPAQLLAWLGPAISQPAFEVGAEVVAAFTASDPDAGSAFLPNSRGRWQGDLYALARRRLAACGVTDVTGGGLCTHTDADRFYSYRREGNTGRMLSFVHLKP